MSINPPPIQQPLIENEKKGTIGFLWALFFNQVFEGDAGTTFTPIINGLTYTVGPPELLGKVYRISQFLTYFRIDIIPAQGGSTSSVLQNTYVDNYPFVMTGNGICGAVASKAGGSLGMCEQATGRIYLPVWTNVASQVTVLGMVEAS